MKFPPTKIPGKACLPIHLEHGSAERMLEIDLNKMPHLLMTGGTPDCHIAVIDKILTAWTPLPWIKPLVIALADNPVFPMSAISVAAQLEKLHEMNGTMQFRYAELGRKGFRNAVEYWNAGFHDMPFHPTVIFGFETLKTSDLRSEAAALIVRLAQKGRAAGINLILSSSGENLLTDELKSNFPAEVTFHDGNTGNFSFSGPVTDGTI